MQCPTGYILRKSYTRKSPLGQKSFVKKACIKAQSQSGLKRSEIDKKKMKLLNQLHEMVRKKYGTPKCKKGQILREGYVATKKSGKRYVVKPKCIKSVTGKPHGKKLFILEKGTLSEFGYHKLSELRVSQRHSALKKALKSMKPLSIYRRLVALQTLNKNVNPTLTKILKEDSDWLKKTKEYKQRK